MDKHRIFIDFGSTFTKVVAFDMEKEELAARVQTPSTVDTDVTIGLRTALNSLSETVDASEAAMKKAMACSSLAGGLKMICIGLVPEYTTEAARIAALGAGAKVIGTYSYELSQSEANEIAKKKPDIILLTGGTDGGNKKTICHNAHMLAGVCGNTKIIVAGNKSAADEVRDIFLNVGVGVVITKNVMPEFGELNLDPVNAEIREIFIRHITEAKGIAHVRSMIADVIMPTPSAVLEAAKLIADGTKSEKGLGELLLVDVGGATTDVCSVASGIPTKSGVTMIGLEEPYAKRTVEGDLGLYHNLDTLSELCSISQYETGGHSEISQPPVSLLRHTLGVPRGEEQTREHLMFSRKAVSTAVERHVGKHERKITHNGEIWLQKGKDLSNIAIVLGGGGPLAFSAEPRYVLEGASTGDSETLSLKPRSPRYVLDSKYILFAIGLLAGSEPNKALRIAKKYLVEV